MMQNLKLKSINEIGLDTHFLIPSYQRGYRWDQTQVINLLDDIYDFMQTKEKHSFYCLQPLSYSAKCQTTIRSHRWSTTVNNNCYSTSLS